MKALLVTVDAWRASHASFDPGVSTPYTPTLERFAESGTAFTQAVAHGPATPYAFPGLLTSTLPLDHGGYERISESRTLLSEALADAGHRCVGVHGNPWLGEKYGYGRGYADYRDVGEFGSPALEWARETLLDRFGLDHPVYRGAQTLYRHFGDVVGRVVGDGSDEVAVAREALAAAGEDAFVWVHLLDPHAPYTPPERHREAMGVPSVSASATALTTRAQRDPGGLSDRERTAVRRLYAAAVRHADERVGEILAAADEETLVVVTADHGEALFEHGQVGHEPALYDELVRVPMLVRPPGDAPPATAAVHGQVRHVDVAPTILDYAGVDPPASFTGRSLRPLIEGASESEPRLAVSEVASSRSRPGRVDPGALRVAVRRPDRKVVATADGDVVGYDLSSDPGENSPIRDPTGDAWAPLRTALDDRLGELSLSDTAAAERDDAVETRLRELGYLE